MISYSVHASQSLLHMVTINMMNIDTINDGILYMIWM